MADDDAVEKLFAKNSSKRREKANCGVAKCQRKAFKDLFCASHYLVMEREGPPQDLTLPGGGPAKSSGPNWWDKSDVTSTWQALKTPEGQDYYFNTETNETSWEKPKELMSSDELNNSGDWRWVPDEHSVYIAARVISDNGKKMEIQDENGMQMTIKSGKYEELKRSSLQRIVSDLVLLDRMSAPLILHCLRERFKNTQIYTSVGTILISINPYKMLPLYGEDMQNRYINREPGMDLPPHVFNVAHDAYFGLTEFHVNQSIIISGESGAGKTEATKQCLRYLAKMAGSVGGVEKKVLQANPILEGFGNAKTLRNDNSSRFGKYLEVYFNEEGQIVGSATRNYLLEKIRVSNPHKGERNFHIFYQLTKGASPAQRNQFRIGHPKEYKFLTSCINVETIDDERDFADVNGAFRDLGFKENDVDELLNVVATVANMGNIEFKEVGRQQTVIDESQDWAERVAQLIQVDLELLKTCMVTKELRVKGQASTKMILNTKQAADTRDALAKFMYAAMFNWLVQRINTSMGRCQRGLDYIGCLDIFGFEIFEHNSFEQLCINFTNEMLQQHFNTHTFKLEEQVYLAERIAFEHIKFIDNAPMIQLITMKPNGILSLLDEELVLPKGSDKGFLEKLKKEQASNPVFGNLMKYPGFFMVKHYAGEVSYDTDGFLEKNRDTLTPDLLEMLYTSKNEFINVLFDKNVVVSSREQKSSLSKQFQNQLFELMEQLNRTEPHYIRCIKPNDDKSPNHFIPRNVFEQLTYSGVFEAVSIRKQGFPFRLTHEAFAKRYSCIFGYDKLYKGGGDPKPVCKAIVDEVKLDRANVQMGVTRMLYRADEHKTLELVRSIKVKVIEVHLALEELMGIETADMDVDTKEEHFKKLAKAIRGADEFRIKSALAEKARQLIEVYVENRMDSTTKRLLDEAVVSKDRKALEHVLTICDQEGYRTKLTAKCREILEVVVECEAALEVARNSLDDEDMANALDMCEENQFENETCEELRQLQVAIAKAKTMCKTVRKSKNHVHIEKTLAFCAKFGYMTPEVQNLQALYKQIMELRSRLEHARQKIDQETLEKTLQHADQLGYKNDVVEECRQLLHRVKRINIETERAAKTLDERHIRAVVAAALEIGLTGNSFKEVKKLKKLCDGSVEKFLEAQMERAKATRQHGKVIRIAVRLKDFMVEQKGHLLTLDQYPKLKDARVWASEKFWGSAEKRAAHFLIWQADLIHSPLTTAVQDINPMEHPDKVQLVRDKIITSFETIQKFMQQRSTTKLEVRVQELLTDALELHEIRDEIYIGLMKQMLKNPEFEKVSFGMELMALCLTVFPPSADFEDYLEAFVRQDLFNNDKFHCSSLLRQRCLDGPVKGRPNFNRGDFTARSLAAHIASNEKDFDDSMPKNATWRDLEMSFYEPRTRLEPYQGKRGKKQRDTGADDAGDYYDEPRGREAKSSGRTRASCRNDAEEDEEEEVSPAPRGRGKHSSRSDAKDDTASPSQRSPAGGRSPPTRSSRRAHDSEEEEDYGASAAPRRDRF